MDDAITVERLHVDQNLVEQVTVVDHLPMKNGDFPLIWHDMAILLGAKIPRNMIILGSNML